MDHRKRLDSIISCFKIIILEGADVIESRYRYRVPVRLFAQYKSYPFQKFVQPRDRICITVKGYSCAWRMEREREKIRMSERVHEIIREEKGHRPSLQIKDRNAWAADKPIPRILIIRCSRRCFIPIKEPWDLELYNWESSSFSRTDFPDMELQIRSNFLYSIYF